MDLKDLTQVSETLEKGSILGSSSGETSALALAVSHWWAPFPGGLAFKPRTGAEQDRALRGSASRVAVARGSPAGTLWTSRVGRVTFGSSSKWRLHQGKWHIGHVLLTN